jgi:hypothetical protein
MLSQRQIDANRRNAQFSTGPRTPEGSAAVGLNALRHGLSAQTTVLPNENPDEFQELLDAFLAEHQPAGPTETLLVEQMAMAAWRLRRMRALETGLFNVRISQLPRDENASALDPGSRAFAYDTSGSRAIETLSRYETRIERAFYRALHELERRRAASPPPDLPVPQDPPPPENDFSNQTHSQNRTPDADPNSIHSHCSNSLLTYAQVVCPLSLAIMAPYALDFAPRAGFQRQPRAWLRCARTGARRVPRMPLSPERHTIYPSGGTRCRYDIHG